MNKVLGEGLSEAWHLYLGKRQREYMGDEAHDGRELEGRQYGRVRRSV